MFSGLIQDIGTVKSNKALRLVVEAPGRMPRLGDSISVNGACLTVASLRRAGRRSLLSFDLSPETVAKTTLGRLAEGERVNLERCLTLRDGLGGHIVQGHVDQTGRISAIKPTKGGRLMTVDAGRAFMRFVVSKGSVTVDGVSLTAVRPGPDSFSVALIPYTLEHTNLSSRNIGDKVNLEADVLGKYVMRYIGGRQ